MSGFLDAGPLLAALRDLRDAYAHALSGAEELAAALVSGRIETIRSATAAQAAWVALIADAEARRQLAEVELVRALHAARSSGGEGAVTASALLPLLSPDDAAELRALRHDLLTTLPPLQVAQRRAATLLHHAHRVVKRALRTTAPVTVGYGPHGEHRLPRPEPRQRQGRRA